MEWITVRGSKGLGLTSLTNEIVNKINKQLLIKIE